MSPPVLLPSQIRKTRETREPSMQTANCLIEWLELSFNDRTDPTLTQAYERLSGRIEGVAGTPTAISEFNDDPRYPRKFMAELWNEEFH